MAAQRISVTSSSVPAARFPGRSSVYRTNSSPTRKVTRLTQANDIRSTLQLRHIRTSFFFDEGFLPSEGAAADFSRFDAILGSIPQDADLLPILAYAPLWLANRGKVQTSTEQSHVSRTLAERASASRRGGGVGVQLVTISSELYTCPK